MTTERKFTVKKEVPEVIPEATSKEAVQLNKTEQTERVRNNMLSVLSLDEDAFKKAINHQFKNNKTVLNVATQAVENLTAKVLTELRDAVEAVMVMGATPTYIRDAEGKITSVEFRNSLSDEDLQHFVVYLPALTCTLTQKIQNKALDSEITSYLADLSLKEKFLSVGEGTIQEKNSAAEMLNVTPKITALIQKRVYSCMKEEVEAANRLYEGLKKVLQHRIEEKRIFTGSASQIV